MYGLGEMPSNESVNSLHLEAEVPPALTTQRGGMYPVNGQLLANLPDLGVKEEGRVNDGLLGRNPHLGVIHLRIHGFGLIHLLVNTHTRTHAHTCQKLQKTFRPHPQNVVLHLHPPLWSRAAASALSFLSPLCLQRGQQLPDSHNHDDSLSLSHPLLKPPAFSFYCTSLEFTDSDDLTFK